MPYISRDLMKQWERQYKYLLRMRDEHGRLRFDQERQFEFLSKVFEVGGNNDGNPDHGSSGIGQEHVGT